MGFFDLTAMVEISATTSLEQHFFWRARPVNSEPWLWMANVQLLDVLDVLAPKKKQHGFSAAMAAMLVCA